MSNSIKILDPIHLRVLRENRLLIILFATALLFDTLSTIFFMFFDGIEHELHPLVRSGAMFYGPVLGPFMFAFLFKLLGGLVVAWYLKQYAHYFLKASIAVAFLAGLYNFGSTLIFLD